MKTTVNDEKRPDDNKMYPFDWIYWDLRDKGEDRLATAVQWLISDRNQAIEDAEYRASRRLQVEGKEEK